MGTSVQVTPLCGVYNENPLSYLVSIDGFNFLLDCGWNDLFDPSLLEPLSRFLSFISISLPGIENPIRTMGMPVYRINTLGKISTIDSVLISSGFQGCFYYRCSSAFSSRYASPWCSSLRYEAAWTLCSRLCH